MFPCFRRSVPITVAVVVQATTIENEGKLNMSFPNEESGPRRVPGKGEQTTQRNVHAKAFRLPKVVRKWPVIVLFLAMVGATTGAVTAAVPSATTQPSPFLITPRALAFGDVPEGSTAASQEITIENVSGKSQVMSGAGGGAGVFGGSQNCQGQTLAPGASCQMFYAFSPTSTGFVSGSTNGTWNGQPFNLKFTGTGTPEFLITPTSLAFGRTKVGATSPEQTISITNESNRSEVMSGAGGGAGVFGGAQNCQGQTLAPGASCQMFYAFTPTTTGVVNGTTNGTWNGQPFNLKFSGNGTP
jgi:hypothetical protein